MKMKQAVVIVATVPVALCAAKFQFNSVLRINRMHTEDPITIFSHGIGADYRQADFYKNVFCSKNYIAFNYPNAPEKLFSCNQKTGLAQSSEIESLSYVIDCSIEYNQPVVFYGVSRGASAIVPTVGSRIQDKKPMPEVKAIILESPFAHCEDIIQGYAQQFKVPPFFMRFLAKRFFKEYDKKKNAPIDYVLLLPKHVPILFICTTEDTIVPVSSTKRLYAKLRESGHEHVYLLEFPEGIHANILWSVSGRAYCSVLHAFYQRYGLPHDEDLAELGQVRLDACQPNF